MTFNLNNKINFLMDKQPQFTLFIKEIQKKIPIILDLYADEWEVSKKTQSITMTITKFNLSHLLYKCGCDYRYKDERKDEKIRITISSYDESEDDADEDRNKEDDKQLFFDIENVAEIPTFYLKAQNQLVGSLYYFINYF